MNKKLVVSLMLCGFMVTSFAPVFAQTVPSPQETNTVSPEKPVAEKEKASAVKPKKHHKLVKHSKKHHHLVKNHKKADAEKTSAATGNTAS